MTRPGTRVWVVRDATPHAVYSYGWGTYLGDQLMPNWDSPGALAMCEKSVHRFDARRDEEGPLIDPEKYYGPKLTAGEITREEVDRRIAQIAEREATERARPVADRARSLAMRMGLNPRIALDRGGHVWGAECWWGEADDDSPSRYAKGRQIWEGPCQENLARRVKVDGSYFRGVVPAGAVYVGRGAPGLPQSPWANPFRPGHPIPVTVRLGGHPHTIDPSTLGRTTRDAGWTVHDVDHAVDLYRGLIRAAELEDDIRAQLSGKALACWCKPDQPCHGDMLVTIANAWVPA